MIEVRNLTFKYKKTIALNNISLSVKRGEVVALVGQNGAGKSTLLKELLRLLPGRVGWMPEMVEPDGYLTVTEFLTFLSEPGSNVISVIKKCGLFDKKDALCSTLSKGTKQRVILALALIAQKDILILDEPSAGLDPMFQKDMISLLKEILKNKTLIISTHNISEIEDLATRIVVLKEGSISYDGPLDRKRSYYEYF